MRFRRTMPPPGRIEAATSRRVGGVTSMQERIVILVMRNQMLQQQAKSVRRQEQKLQQRLNRISNVMIGNQRIWELDRLAMELEAEAHEIESAFDSTDMNEIRLAQVAQCRADALFLRRLEWDLGELHVAVRGDTARRGGRYDQAEWKGQRP